MTFGERLDTAIRDRGLKQRAFAKAIGVSEVSVSRYISGERIPKLNMVVKMADILGVSIDWLVGRDIEQERKATNGDVILSAIPVCEVYEKEETMKSVVVVIPRVWWDGEHE